MDIKFLSTLFFSLICFISIAQDISNKYEFEASVFIPNTEIKKILDDNFENCFREKDFDTLIMQHSLKFFREKDSIALVLNSGSKVLDDVSVEWNLLNIQGVFYYKKQLVIIEADKPELYILDYFFKKKCKRVKIETELNFVDPLCGAKYLIKDKKLLLSGRFNSF